LEHANKGTVQEYGDHHAGHKGCAPKFRERRAEESMSDLRSSVWRTAYVAAILESDGARITHRVSKARAAINERLNSRVEITPNELEAIDAAVQKLATLKGPTR
jgi:hypothetical protein